MRTKFSSPTTTCRHKETESGRLMLADGASLSVARKPVVQQKLATEIVTTTAHVLLGPGMPAKHVARMFPILETELRANYIEGVSFHFAGQAHRRRREIQRA